MARAFILGHGQRIPGQDKTFVPAGRSISFYSEVDENTLRSNGLAALNAGDIPPVETFDAESEVYNYTLSRFEDSAIAEHMASESSLTGGKSYFIGMDTLPSPLLLCTSPQACAKTKPRHSLFCKGLFKLVAEEELLSVTCRGVRGQKNPATSSLGAPKVDDKGHDTSEDFNAETTAEGNRLLALSKTDAAAAIAQIEALSEPTRQMLFGNVYALELFTVDYYKQGGAATPEAVLEGRRALEALGEESFADHVDKYEIKQKEMVLGDAALKSAYERSAEKRIKARLREEQLMRERLGIIERQRTIREEALVQIDTMQKQASEIGIVISSLSGTESDQDTIVTLTAAFLSLMGFVETIQRIADKEALKTVISLAATVYRDGADLGEALSFYSEIQDTDNLNKLKTAIEKVLQSAAPLSGAVPKDLPDPPPIDSALTS
jgi:hypothetical protein